MRGHHEDIGGQADGLPLMGKASRGPEELPEHGKMTKRENKPYGELDKRILIV